MSHPAFLNDSYPSVELVQQEAISVEATALNGRQQDVYVVVKNQPFNIKLRAVSNGKTVTIFVSVPWVLGSAQYTASPTLTDHYYRGIIYQFP